MNFFLQIIVVLFVDKVHAQFHPRIQQLYLNKSATQKIYLSPGLATSVKMPCEIDEVITPGTGILNHLSERNKTRFSLEITNEARSTNFIVHCVDSTYVFDLVVNKNIHNDYIEIIGDYGSPRMTQVPSSQANTRILDLIKKSEAKLSQELISRIDANRTNFNLKDVEKLHIYRSK